MNAARQLGGSAGIAMLVVYIQQHIGFHLLDILTNLITLPAVLLLRRPKEVVHVEAVMD